ncbi:MAG: anti-sigma factor [Solirubrobacterales bacterium]|nr:anti-sigma factor [Solirubrobacterales bacterium]
MSEIIDHHERWHDEIAAYALDAMDEREAAIVEQHLHECEACAERFRWLAPAVNVIPASVAQLEPPPQLRERLMTIVHEEAKATGLDAAPAHSSSRGEGRRRWLPSFEGFALRPALAGAAALLLLIAGVGGYELRNETSPSGSSVQTYAATAGANAPAASGTLRVNGDEGSLRVANLPATERGQVYQAWIKDEEGSIHPSSVFVLSDDGTGVVSLPAGLTDAEQVMVTREPKGGSQSPHENPLIAATLD